MREYACASAVDALLRVGNDVVTNPDFVVAPRGKMTHEVRNVTIQVNDPSDCTMLGISRGWNSKIAVAEFLQLAGGFSDPDVMVAVQPAFREFLDPSGKFWGAYGERTGIAMDALVRRLEEQPDTRQGVLAVWSNDDDLLSGDHLDFPCTAYLNFTVREGSLLMTTHMRSNDLWRGWSYDAFQFMQLGHTLANYLDVNMGVYTHMVDSMHMYVDDMEAFFSLTPSPEPDARPRLTGLDALGEHSWREVQEIAMDLFYEVTTCGSGPTEKWMCDTGLGDIAAKVLEERLRDASV